MRAQPECPPKMQSSSIVSLVNVYIFPASTFTSLVPTAKVQVTPTHTFQVGISLLYIYVYGRMPLMACAMDCLPAIALWS